MSSVISFEVFSHLLANAPANRRNCGDSSAVTTRRKAQILGTNVGRYAIADWLFTVIAGEEEWNPFMLYELYNLVRHMPTTTTMRDLITNYLDFVSENHQINFFIVYWRVCTGIQVNPAFLTRYHQSLSNREYSLAFGRSNHCTILEKLFEQNVSVLFRYCGATCNVLWDILGGDHEEFVVVYLMSFIVSLVSQGRSSAFISTRILRELTIGVAHSVALSTREQSESIEMDIVIYNFIYFVNRYMQTNTDRNRQIRAAVLNILVSCNVVERVGNQLRYTSPDHHENATGNFSVSMFYCAGHVLPELRAIFHL